MAADARNPRASQRARASIIACARTSVQALAARSRTGGSPFCSAQIRCKQQRAASACRFPTTTIGSFPQTAAIRAARAGGKCSALELPATNTAMPARKPMHPRAGRARARRAGARRAERNDMVEYFGEQLRGFAFTEHGWVQCYGSRCVKPPIIFGDVQPPDADDGRAGSRYAQCLTEQPMKGMLTGPVTILQWSFVRDDQPRADTALQIALAIRDEVLDLEQAGIGSSRSTSRRCAKACRCARATGTTTWMGRRRLPPRAPRRRATRRRSTPTCATPSSTTSCRDRRAGRRRDHDRDLALGHGAARRLRRRSSIRTRSARASTTSIRRACRRSRRWSSC